MLHQYRFIQKTVPNTGVVTRCFGSPSDFCIQRTYVIVPKIGSPIEAKVAAGGVDCYSIYPLEIAASPQPRAQPIYAQYCDLVPSTRSSILSQLHAPFLGTIT